MELIFQELSRKDLESVLEIEKLSFSEPWNRGMFEREVGAAHSNFFVARAGEKIVGYGGFWKTGDEGDIINLAIHPDLRSRGLGRKLLEFLLNRAKKSGIKRLVLEVRSRNANAQKLYASFGFSPIAVRLKYYSDDDAIIMEKTGT